MINNESFFFIGIKGVMMANMAVILKKMGKSVTGTDIEEEFITDSLLKKENIKYFFGFSPDILPQSIDCIVYAASHGGANNPLIVEAKKRNIKVIHQAELLGEIIKSFKTKIAVCGCHGKTTTSSLLSYALINLGVKPSYCVGVPFFGTTQGSDFQEKDYFVVEADEYGLNPPFDKTPKFNFLDPDYIICTNIDFDHPDVYRDLKETKNAFYKFFVNSNDRKKLILNADDPNMYQLINRLIQDQFVTYGTNGKADYKITNIKTVDNGTQFEILRETYTISLFGEKNVLNTAAVVVMLLQLGFKPDEIQKSIQRFQGAERRMQKIYEENDIQLFDDYAHHPNEIKATIDALRKRFPNKRLIVIFQPHTYSRTKSLLKEFASSLSLADLVYVLPIFASAREKQDHSINASSIAKLSPKKITSFDNAVQPARIATQPARIDSQSVSGESVAGGSIELLKTDIKAGDIIITMGAGDVYKLNDKIIQQIKNLKLKI